MSWTPPANPPRVDGLPRAPSAKPPKPAEQLNLDGAVPVTVPVPTQDLTAASFSTPDGKQGWVLKIPGGRPIATPAYANGKLFIGGGYGSHEFYAFHAETGKVIWKISTQDDGPTAPVVEDGYVAFNTESCTLMVVDEETGKVVWQEWLGDPMMSQPPIDKGRVFIAFPGGQRDAARRARGASFHPQPAVPGGSHRLLAADLRSGRHIWEQTIAGEVISAPVISEDVVYFTTFDGTSYAITATDGAVVWVKKNAGTSAPVVAADHVVMTRKEVRGTKSYEGLARIDSKKGADRDGDLLARERAAYLDAGAGGGVALSPQSTASLV
jgi:Ca-activated chloride channel homolog